MKIKKGLLGDTTVSLNLGLGQISLEFWNTVPESKEGLKMYMHTQPY